MKREFLKGFNLDDETIDKIMSKHGEVKTAREKASKHINQQAHDQI